MNARHATHGRRVKHAPNLPTAKYWEAAQRVVAQPSVPERWSERGLVRRSKSVAWVQSWRLGAGYEFEQRPDGLAALKSTYQMQFNGAPKSMDLGLLYQAIEQRQVDMVAANATDGMLSKLDLHVLDDDRHAFPPYQVCLAAREDRLKQWPNLGPALGELSGKFTNQAMQALNYQVDVVHRPVKAVAAEFLKASGLTM